MARLTDLIADGEYIVKERCDDSGDNKPIEEEQGAPLPKYSRNKKGTIPRGEYSEHIPKELSPKGARVLLAGYFREQVGQMRTCLRKRRKNGYTPEGYEALKAWFDNDFDEGPFSFAGVCNIFRLEPDYVRRMVYTIDPRKSYRSLGRNDKLEEKL